MPGGLCVQANLLCVTWSAAQGHVFLFDLEARQRLSAWALPPGRRGYSDAAGVALDPHFHLFVADPHNDRVCHFSVFGRHLGDLGLPPPEQGDQGRDRPGVLDRPHGLCLHDGELWVACGDRPRRRAVQRFAVGGELRRPLPSGGDPEQAFGAPRALAVDDHGILVADTLHGRVQRFRRDGTFVAHLPVGRPGEVCRPVAVLRLHGGAVLVADRGDQPGPRVLQPDGAKPVAVERLATECPEPLAFAADAQGRVYVLDHGGERVVRFSRDLRFDQVVVDLAEHLQDHPRPEP